MERRDATYEWLRDTVSGIEAANNPTTRRLLWVTPQHSLALARDVEGRIEAFIASEPLAASLRTVADVLEHQVWSLDDGSKLAANRLVLPAGEHFDHFGALFCVELIDHGLHDDPQTAFTAVEPLVSLALTREMVTDQTLMGLIGELSTLEGLLTAASPTAAAEVLRSWAGSSPSARDFQLGGVGVEVKTTQGPASVHQVEGVHQVELGHSNDGEAESALFMLSLGLGWITVPQEGRSLPELVDSILELVPDPADRTDLLARIMQYGGDAAVGYNHDRDRGKVRYATRYYFRFERLYDMSDDRLRLLTSAHLTGLKNIDPGSVTFRVALEDRVRGERNPINGWSELLPRLLERAGLTPA